VQGYPQVIPEVVIERLGKFFKPDLVLDVISRPAGLFGGKSPVDWVAQGGGTWEQVLAKYEVMFSYQVTA
jgi:hypothetical protein